MKKALIMEGGGMRGMFTCGVIDVFLENDIRFDGAAGVSAGAVFGCNFKSRQIGRAIRYNKRYAGDPRFGSFRCWLKTGDIYEPQFSYHDLPDKLDVFDRKTFRENPMEFWLAATNVETGLPVYHLCTDGEDNDIEWMRASAAIPVLSSIVEIDGLKLLDGGASDSVPYRFMMEKQGYFRSVTVLTQPEGFVKEKNKMLPLIRLKLRKYPKMVEALAKRHIFYNELYRYIESREKLGETLIIRPSAPLNIGNASKDPAELERVYQEGRKAAESRLEEIKRFLKLEYMA